MRGAALPSKDRIQLVGDCHRKSEPRAGFLQRSQSRSERGTPCAFVTSSPTTRKACGRSSTITHRPSSPAGVPWATPTTTARNAIAQRRFRGIFAAEEAHQEGFQAPLQPLERVDPPSEHAPRPRSVLDPGPEARRPRGRVPAAQPDSIPRARRRFGLGDEGDARRGDVGVEATARCGDGG